MIVVNPISPVAFSVFGFDIRWYALAYIISFILGYVIFRRLSDLTKKQVEDLLTYVILGVVIGGRLGFVLFYNLPYFIAHPIEIFFVWQGGMAFHGGMLGVAVAVSLFAYFNKLNALSILDRIVIVAPIGLFFGRIANFINMEVMGRLTNSPLGMVFYGYEDLGVRYPSPLFQAFGEGIVLGALMFSLWRWTRLRDYPGALMSIAAMGYAIVRIITELFREPDAQLGFLTSWGLTMGQLLSTLMFVIALGIFVYAIKGGKNGK